MPKILMKDGKVIKETGTVQPTPEQLQEQKLQRIKEQSEQRAKFERGREQGAVTTAPVSATAEDKPATSK